MGFHRQGQPAALDRAAIRDAVSRFLADELAFEIAAADPFRIDNDCVNPAGHEPIASCGEVVCCHCARIFWR